MFDEDDYKLFSEAKKRVDPNLSDYAFAKQMMKKEIAGYLFGEEVVKATPVKMKAEDAISLARGTLEKERDKTHKTEKKLFDLASSMKRSGRFNQEFDGAKGQEKDAEHAINFKRELESQKMAVLSNAIFWLEKVQNKDWAGLDELLPKQTLDRRMNRFPVVAKDDRPNGEIVR